MIETYIFKHIDGHTSIFTYSEIVENAKRQKAEGIEPCFRYDFGNGDYSEPGFLVLSGINGAVVCVLYENNNALILKGVQGDFIFG